MKVLVDTGATNSIIRESSLAQIQVHQRYPVQQQFFLANKTSISIIGYVNLQIQIQHVKTFVTAAIARTLSCDLILGEDWIKTYRVTINRVNDIISILDNQAVVHLRPSCDKQLTAIKSDYVSPSSSLSINTINNDRKTPSSTVTDVVQTIEQVIHHIDNLQERMEIRHILKRHKKVFDISTSTIARTSIHHTIPTGDHPPINSVPYRGSLQQQQALRQMIQKLEQSNQIRPSTSPWSSPVLLIKKKDGDYRFVVDYRKLNTITVKDSYPIPTIESTIQQLAGNRYFSKLDLRSGYFQIPINEDDKPKTAFITTTGLWEFNVLPMGLKNAPPSFQRIMYNLLVNGREQYCLVYLDDIIIFSKTFDDHLMHLDEILNILENHQFQLNPGKCSIMKKCIDYLGHSIDEYGITPLHDNIRAIRQMELPNPPTLKQANEFVGGIGFYRKFIKNFSKIAAPLHRVTNLTKNNKHLFTWGDEQQEAVHQLKAIITGPDLVLDFPDPELSYILSTDASKIGLGAVLKQVTRDGKLKVIYYLSRVLSKSEVRYSTTELEALAMVWAITKLRSYLLGHDFKVETDHCPLCQFHRKQSRNGRLDRWAVEILSEYNITEIKYKKGKCHCDADLLSRYPLVINANTSNDLTIRSNQDTYLFSRINESDDDDVEIQPTATINIITRAKDYDQPTPLSKMTNRPNSNLQSDETSITHCYNTRSKTRRLNHVSMSPQGKTHQTTTFSPSSLHTNNQIITTLPSASTNSNQESSSVLEPDTNSILPSIKHRHDIFLKISDFSIKKLKIAQAKDDDIQKFIHDPINNNTYTIIDEIIYKLVPRGRKKIKLPWIPKTMINQILFLYHDHPTAAHFGINKTLHKLTSKYYWPNMCRTITNYIKSCMKCSKYNYIRTKRPGKMNIIPTPNDVMGLVGMDYWGPTDVPTARGNRYVITMTDYVSKFVFARAVKTNSAQEAADFFLDICYHYGPPAKLITDQGSHFVAELTRTIVESCNTTHVLATPYHPTSNAQTERFNATFAPALAKLITDQTKEWDDFLQPVIYAYNTSRHATTTLTPFQIMFTRENQLLMDPKQLKVSLMKPNQYYDKVKHARKLIIDQVKQRIQQCSKSAKKRYDLNRPDPIYQKNDLVLIRVVNKKSKWQEKFEGPYRVIDQIGPATFIVRIENPDNDMNPQYTKQVTTADMKHVFHDDNQ